MFLKPTPPPFDPIEWLDKPFAEKARLVCQAWAMQGYGAPIIVYLAYLVKIALYVLGWVYFASFGEYWRGS